MYLCEHCQQQIAANTPAYSITVQTRNATYPKRSQANWRYVKRQIKYFDDKGGEGFETVKNLTVCPSCYKQLS